MNVLAFPKQAAAFQPIGHYVRWHNIGVPIIMDYTAGLVGEALISMNVVSGTAHSFGEQTSFTTTNWGKAPKARDTDEQGGRVTRIGLTALGRSFTSAELEVLMSAHGARGLLLPNDKRILPNGLDDLRLDPRRFNAAEAQRRVDEISAIPTVNRPDRFADRRMREIVATAKKAAKLNSKPDIAEEYKIDTTQLRARLVKHRQTSEKLRATYEAIAQERTEQGTAVKTIGNLRLHVAKPETGTR